VSSVSWPTVALSATISVGVAGLVTLGLDFVARPRLEARKERLLDRYRAVHEAGQRLMAISMAAGMLAHTQEPAVDANALQSFREEVERIRLSIVQETVELQAAMPRFILAAPALLQATVPGVVGRIRGIALSSRSHNDVGEEVGLFVAGPADYLLATRLRRLGRRRRLRRWWGAVQALEKAASSGSADSGL
jgi:hypothetical protein